MNEKLSIALIGLLCGWLLARISVHLDAYQTKHKSLSRALANLLFVLSSLESFKQILNSQMNASPDLKTLEMLRQRGLQRVLGEQNVTGLLDDSITDILPYAPLFANELRNLRGHLHMTIDMSLDTSASTNQEIYIKLFSALLVGTDALIDQLEKAAKKLSLKVGALTWLRTMKFLANRKKKTGLQVKNEQFVTDFTKSIFDELEKSK